MGFGYFLLGLWIDFGSAAGNDLAIFIGTLFLTCRQNLLWCADILIAVDGLLDLFYFLVLLLEVVEFCLQLNPVAVEAFNELTLSLLFLQLLSLFLQPLNFVQDIINIVLGVLQILSVIDISYGVVISVAVIDDHGGLCWLWRYLIGDRRCHSRCSGRCCL